MLPINILCEWLIKSPGRTKQQESLSVESMVMDLQDPAACRKACEDIDMVIYFAADADPEANFDGSLLGK